MCSLVVSVYKSQGNYECSWAYLKYHSLFPNVFLSFAFFFLVFFSFLPFPLSQSKNAKGFNTQLKENAHTYTDMGEGVVEKNI